MDDVEGLQQPAPCVMGEFILNCYLLLISQAMSIRFLLYEAYSESKYHFAVKKSS